MFPPLLQHILTYESSLPLTQDHPHPFLLSSSSTPINSGYPLPSIPTKTHKHTHICRHAHTLANVHGHTGKDKHTQHKLKLSPLFEILWDFFSKVQMSRKTKFGFTMGYIRFFVKKKTRRFLCFLRKPTEIFLCKTKSGFFWLSCFRKNGNTNRTFYYVILAWQNQPDTHG